MGLEEAVLWEGKMPVLTSTVDRSCQALRRKDVPRLCPTERDWTNPNVTECNARFSQAVEKSRKDGV